VGNKCEKASKVCDTLFPFRKKYIHICKYLLKRAILTHKGQTIQVSKIVCNLLHGSCDNGVNNMITEPENDCSAYAVGVHYHFSRIVGAV